MSSSGGKEGDQWGITNSVKKNLQDGAVWGDGWRH